MTKNPSLLKKKIFASALSLAGRHGWTTLTSAQIAKHAKISVAQFQSVFSDKDKILPDLIAYTDARLQKVIKNIDSEGSPRDRLFEVIMARIDLLQENRTGFCRIIEDVRRSPKLFLVLVKAQRKSAHDMLALAGIKVKRPAEPLLVAALMTIYALTLHRWMRDETVDVHRTMALLDRVLLQAERIARVMKCAE